MSITTEIQRLRTNVNNIRQNTSDILDAIANKGVEIPAGSTLDDCAGLISQIETGGVPPYLANVDNIIFYNIFSEYQFAPDNWNYIDVYPIIGEKQVYLRKSNEKYYLDNYMSASTLSYNFKKLNSFKIINWDWSANAYCKYSPSIKNDSKSWTVCETVAFLKTNNDVTNGGLFPFKGQFSSCPYWASYMNYWAYYGGGYKDISITFPSQGWEELAHYHNGMVRGEQPGQSLGPWDRSCLQGIDPTQPHIYAIEYNDKNKTLGYYLDGVLYLSYDDTTVSLLQTFLDNYSKDIIYAHIRQVGDINISEQIIYNKAIFSDV